MRPGLLLLFLTAANISYCQNGNTIDTTRASLLSDRALSTMQAKYASIADKVDRHTLKIVSRMQQKELRLRRSASLPDSARASEIFNNAQTKYRALQEKLQSPVNITPGNSLKQYLPGIDSVSTILHFLTLDKFQNVSPDQTARLGKVALQVQQLQARLQQANDAQAFFRDREQQLTQQLSQPALLGQLRGINKEVFYYQQQLQQYKDLVNNKEKLEQMLFARVVQIPAFQKFWQQNSMLAQLFPMPASSTGQDAVNGLPSRQQLRDIISAQLPSSGGDPAQYMQQQLQGAQGQLGSLQNQVAALSGAGNCGGGQPVMPDFTPNALHNKSILQHLQVSFNFQTARQTSNLPAIADIGFMLGYKFSNNLVLGTGIAYQLGLGHGISDISLTNQGIGLRSFIDARAKRSIWISGGYEYNYMQQFKSIASLKRINLWQRSALAGITKKYNIGKKEGNVQLLYDFLATNGLPSRVPLVFRFGYSF